MISNAAFTQSSKYGRSGYVTLGQIFRKGHKFRLTPKDDMVIITHCTSRVIAIVYCYRSKSWQLSLEISWFYALSYLVVKLPKYRNSAILRALPRRTEMP
jgi:hypothetical protein